MVKKNYFLVFLIIISILIIQGLTIKVSAGEGETRALSFLPHDRHGGVDWVTAVAKGLIKPIASLDPEFVEKPLLQLDVLIKTNSEKGVLFSHAIHNYWLNCDACHPAIFKEKKGENGINMTRIMRGELCGECHGKVAFSIYSCDNCHKEEKDITSKWKK